MLALTIGTLLAIGALAFVLYPLFVAPARRARHTAAARNGEEESVIALREIEFDRQTGKLSDSDYTELKARYTERALAEMRMSSAVPPGVLTDVAEAAVLAYRARAGGCAAHGPRPEPDAEYCSECGLFLAGKCTSCGKDVPEAGAVFCSACGFQLAA